MLQIEKTYLQRLKLYATDIANEQNCEYIFKKYKPSIVFHFAAESHVDNSIKDCSSVYSHKYNSAQ
jgi:dTDP-D-glucose 4,6-dehydratase